MPTSPNEANAVSATAESFGGYRLVAKLGEGGMAVVYRAVSDGPEGFQRTVVLKRIRPELSRNDKFVRMFLSEARLCARLHHPGIVQVHALGDVAGEYFLAMEYVDGVDLATALSPTRTGGPPMPPGVACYLASEVASALAYAHSLTDENGRPLEIVHRDVSPSNLMVTRHGAVKLLDFGIARAAAHVRSTDERTKTGAIKGKLAYLSPEQADAQPLDRRSDLYALGIVLYECLTGERLRQADDDLELLRVAREGRVWPPSSRRPDLDPDLDAVVLRLLARSPEARYQTGEEVVAALQPLVHRLHGDSNALKQWVSELKTQTAIELAPTTPGKALSPARADSTATHSGELRPATPAISTAARRGDGHWRLVAALGATLVAGAAGVLYAVGGRAPPPKMTAAAPPKPAAPPPAEVVTPPVTPTPKIHLAVRSPRGAEVELDGAKLGVVPIDLMLPSRGESRRLVVSHEGFVAATHLFAGNADAIVDEPLRHRGHTTPRAHTPPGATTEEAEIKDPF